MSLWIIAAGKAGPGESVSEGRPLGVEGFVSMMLAEAVYLAHDPVHRAAFAVGTFSMVGALLQPLLPLSDMVHRRAYWSLTVAATVLLSLSMVPHWRMAITTAVVIFVMFVVVAFFSSNYIKINGKVQAASLTDSLSEAERTRARTDPTYDPAPDAYAGMTSAKKFWWILVGLIAMFSVSVYPLVFDPSNAGWKQAAMAGGVALMAIGLGFGDASWDYPIARRQYVQLVIVGIITLGTFPALYVLAHFAGRRWPYRNKRSFEYIHPRFKRARLQEPAPHDGLIVARPTTGEVQAEPPEIGTLYLSQEGDGPGQLCDL